MLKKILVTLGIIFLLVIIALYFTLGQITDYAVKTAINTYGPEMTQTKVQVESVDISPFEGSGAINGLQIGNPPGYQAPDAFSLGRIYVDVTPSSLLSNKVQVNEIEINHPHFVVETNLKGNNINTILENIQQNTKTAEQQTSKESGGKKEKTFVIHKLVVDDGTIQVGLMGQNTTVKLNKIEIENFSPEGITAPQATAKILQVILNQVAQQSADIASNAHEALSNAASSTHKSVSSGVQNATDKLTDSVNDLFGGKSKS